MGQGAPSCSCSAEITALLFWQQNICNLCLPQSSTSVHSYGSVPYRKLTCAVLRDAGAELPKGVPKTLISEGTHDKMNANQSHES